MKTLRRLMVSVLSALLLLALATSVSAAKPELAEGAFTSTSFTVTSERVAGGNTIIEFEETHDITGSLAGSAIIEGFAVIHPTGEITFNQLETFTGTFDGAAGTSVWRVVGSTKGGLYWGAFSVLGGSGGLANLRGAGHFQEVVVGTGNYSGNFHLSP